MQFAFPGVLWLAGAAGLVTLALHLLSWRRPEPRRLPTARFIPETPQRALSRRLELSDAMLLALRLLVIAAIALAVAGPKWIVKRSGIARIVVVDRSRSVESPGEAMDSAVAVGTGASITRLILFDSAAVMLEGSESPDSSRVEARGDLGPALVLAAREAASLRARFDSVDVVVVSPTRAEELSSATARILGEAGLSPRLVPVRAREIQAPPGVAGTIPPASDPIGAAFRLANGGVSAGLRVVRAEPDEADSAHARSGGVLVVWPAEENDSVQADGILSASSTTVALRAGRGLEPQGTPIAWWRDGSVAATVEAAGEGCIRRVAVRVEPRGDATLRPAFLRFVRDLSRSCDWVDTVAATLPAPVAGPRTLMAVSEATAFADASSMTQRLLLILALIGLAAEWWLRRKGVGSGVSAQAAVEGSAR